MRFLITFSFLIIFSHSQANVPDYFTWLWYYHKMEKTEKLDELIYSLQDTLETDRLQALSRIRINKDLGRFYHYIERNGIASEYLATAFQNSDSILSFSEAPDKKLLEEALDAMEKYLEVQFSMGNYRYLPQDVRRVVNLRHQFYSDNQLNYHKGDVYLGILLYHQKKYDSAEYVLLNLHNRIRYSHEVFDMGTKTYLKTNYYLAKIYRLKNDIYKWRYFLGMAVGNFFTFVNANDDMPSDRYKADLHYDQGDLFVRLNDQKSIKKLLPLLQRTIKTDYGWINSSYKATTQVRVPALVTHAKIDAVNGNFERTVEYFSEASRYLINFISQGFNALSESEREYFYAKNKRYFDELNSYLAYVLSRKPAVEAEVSGLLFNNQLNTKAFLLEEQVRLQHKISVSEDETVRNLYRQYQDLKQIKAQSYFSNHILDSLDYSIQQLEKALSARFPDFTERKVHTWQDVRDRLLPGEVAVEMIRVEGYEWIEKTETIKKNKTRVFDYLTTAGEVIYLVLIIDRNTQDHPKMVLLRNGRELEGKYLAFFRNSILFKTSNNESYDHYWKKLNVYLNGYEKIYFSADGVYNQLSLSALKNPETNRYLTDEQNIIHISSTRDLLKEKPSVGHTRKSYLFGNPSFSLAGTAAREEAAPETLRSIRSLRENTYPPLPGTELEVETVFNLLANDGAEVSKYLGETATENQLKTIRSPQLLHIATHGYFFDGTIDHQSPLLNSGLLFSGVSDQRSRYHDENSDGILSAYEASLLNLDGTDLVVLSACETGLGKTKNGEGVYGLQRALQIAGAKQVMVSLWKVDDEATKQLMERFYEYAIKQDIPYRQALYQAQRQVRLKYPEPYYWAAFRIIGN